MSPDLAKSGEEAAIQVGLGGGKGTEILRCKSSKGAFYMYGKKKKKLRAPEKLKHSEQ